MNGEKKKLLIIAGAIVGIVILTIIILLIFHAVTNRKMTFAKVETTVLNATKKYYKDNQTLLPENGKQVSISDATLTAGGYLKALNEITAKLEATCTATSVVTNKDGSYRYTVLLDCGDKYTTKTLSSYVQSAGTVTSGDGLYQLNGELVFRGENPNNYIKLSGKLYRIVKIVDNKALLIYNERLVAMPWDNRYNIDKAFTVGINDYNVSRIHDKLLTLDIITNEKAMLAKQTLYTGKRAESDTYNDGSIEKSNILENQVFGVLPLYDYINASTDNNCMSAATKSCSNYNYLNKYDYSWWTITGDTSTSYNVYSIEEDGTIDIVKANSNNYVRPTVLLESDVLYASGDGTLEKPYLVK